MIELATNKLNIKSWCSDLEQGAWEQAKNLAHLPFAFKHIALMPDAHQGYGMPIGGVMATEKVVVPNAVGVDIGCGMIAVKTSIKELDHETIKKIMGGSKEYQGGIRSYVPVGRNHQSKKQKDWLSDEQKRAAFSEWSIIAQEYESSLKQIGTLGGGK